MRARTALGLAWLVLGFVLLAGQGLAAAPAGGAGPLPGLPTATPTLTPPPLPGGWTLGPSFGNGRTTSFAAVGASGPKDVWAVGVDHGIASHPYAVHWDGQQWELHSPQGFDAGLTSVAVVGPNDVWVGGAPNMIQHWNGSDWTLAVLPVGWNIRGMAASGSTDVWAIAEQTMLHWAGPRWVEVPLATRGTAAQPYAVAAAARTDAWVVGDQWNAAAGAWRTLIQHWDGLAWRVVPSPNAGPGNHHLAGVTIIAKDDVWAVGSYDDHGVTRTLTLHWNGQTWSVVSSPNRGLGANALTGVSASGPKDVWAVGTAPGPSTNQTLVEHWDGQRWSLVASPNKGWLENSLAGVVATGPANAWAVGYHATNGMDLYGQGLTLHYQVPYTAPPDLCVDALRRVAVPVSGALVGAATLAPDDIWAVGRQRIIHWDGSAWNAVPGPSLGNGGSLAGVAGTGPNDVWAVGAANDGQQDQPLTLHWNGAFWDWIPSPGGPGTLRAVAARAANDAWAVGTTTVNGIDQALILHWNGHQWLPVNPQPDVASSTYLNGVTALAANDAWAVGASGSAEGASLILHWNGQTWRAVSTPNVRVLYAVAAVSATDVWAVGGAGGAQQALHWDGVRWTAFDTGTWVLSGIAVRAANDVWAVGHDGWGGRYSAAAAVHWDGTAWTRVGTTECGVYSAQYNAVAAPAPNDAWALGAELGVPLVEHYTGPCSVKAPAP